MIRDVSTIKLETMSSTDELLSKSSSIKAEIRQIRGTLFDMDDANYNLSKIFEKFQQLAEAENAVVELQRNEILSLKEQLRKCYEEKNQFGSSDMKNLAADIKMLEASKSRINEEINTLKKQVKILASERTSLIKEVEVYGHMSELGRELEEEQNARRQLEDQVKKLRKQLTDVLAEKNAAKDKAETEAMIREEMQKEMKTLYEEKIAQDKQLADLQASGSNPPSVASFMYEEDIERLKKEIDAIRAENESLRVTAKREAATRRVLDEEIKSLSAESFMMKKRSSYCEDPRDAAASRKRALFLSQGSVGRERLREYNRSISYEPRVRLGSGGSDNSLSHESDNVSVLFGQDSIAGRTSENPESTNSNDSRSDHKGIRAHAEKLLYWANKAAERNKACSSNSVSSGLQSVLRQHSVPASIGLPPRSQSCLSRGRKPGLLPPRPPQAPLEDGAVGIERTESIGSVGDKENGTSFNILTKRKPNVVCVSDHAVIHNLDKIETMGSCQCSVSPFSGNDPHAEFYLPKLGLACTCGHSSIVEERRLFSKNPTSLKNILRRWQCEFLLSLNVETADQLLRAHKSGANDIARQMKRWREQNNMSPANSKECYVALQIWSRTAKVVLRSIKKQREAGEEIIEKPSFLDITIADTHSVSTLGHLSSVGGRMSYEMMEI